MSDARRGTPSRRRCRRREADIETLARAVATLAEQVGDDPDVFELEAALESLNPKTEAADKHLDAWEKKNRKRQG